MVDRRLDARHLLGREGPFAARLKGYEARDGQLQVAEQVQRMLAGDRVLLAEAGTGIGKTFAYLVPAILSGRKIVISTATKTLQNQIASRDLPLVQEVLGTSVPVALVKGISNYLCRRRYKEFLMSPEAMRPGYARELETVRGWVGETETGDLSELVTMAESSRVRLAVASSSETRLGAKCPHHGDCFISEMKRDAEAAQIVVVNHHLFFADLALRGAHPGRVLPEYDAVIFDEAHQIEDTAALFFGARVTSTQVERLARDAERVLARTSELGRLDPSTRSPELAHLRHAASDLFAHLAASAMEGRLVLPPETWTGTRRDLYLALDGRLCDLGESLGGRAERVTDDLGTSEMLDQLSRRASTLRDDLEVIVKGQKGKVCWMEVAGGMVSLSSTPVDLSGILGAKLFEDIPAVGLMSATLSTGGSTSKSGFSFVRRRLGIADDSARVDELSVPSPFDFENHCVLYLPADLPSPGTDSFVEAAVERTAQLIEISGGGAFVLTTSIASMKRMHRLLRSRLPDKQFWVQGERPREALLSAFRGHGHGVLVATSSFWEGVDVPGEALRLVVLEKLPFAVPSDPVFRARSEAIESRGGSSFNELSLPGAAIALKQGFGRLIRREDDVGIVALLDERISSRGYGKRLLAALPPARRTSSLDEVRRAANAFLNLD